MICFVTTGINSVIRNSDGIMSQLKNYFIDLKKGVIFCNLIFLGEGDLRQVITIYSYSKSAL